MFKQIVVIIGVGVVCALIDHYVLKTGVYDGRFGEVGGAVYNIIYCFYGIIIYKVFEMGRE